MPAVPRDVIIRSILWSFLREILKDGQVDDQEKATLQTLVKLLGVDQATFDELSVQVRAELEADPAAGSLDPLVFMRRASRQLLAAFPAEQVKPILAKIAGVLQVDPKEIEEREAELLSPPPEPEPGQEPEGRFRVRDKEGVRFVEVTLRNEAVRTEAGAMRYYRGDIEMESQSSGGGITGFFKAAMSGETFHKPVYRGTGLLVLEPSFSNYFLLDLKDEAFILDQGAYWASDMDVKITAERNQAANALLSGEGWYQTKAEGTGTVVVVAPGPVERLELKNELLVVDGSFAVARSAGLSFQVSRSTKSLWGSLTSGEGLVNRISGTGVVYLAPVPNRNLLLKGLMGNPFAARAAR
jgi:uncharacterized protein (AIM24 family)